MRWPLRYQILLPMTGVTLLALAGVSVLTAVLAAQRSERDVAAQLAAIAQSLRGASFPLTESVLRQMRGLSGAEFVVVGADRSVAASSSAEVGQADMLTGTPTADGLDFRHTIEIGGVSYFHAATATRPVREQDHPAMLHILYPERSWRESRWQAAMPPLAVGAVALGLAVAVAAWLSRRLSGPIGQLRSQVGRIAQGNFQPIPRPERDDELRDLVDSVNSMATQLDESRHVIKRTERLALLGQLSGGLAHELRNAVAGAQLAIQLHERHCPGDDAQSLSVALRQLQLTETHLRRFLAVGQPRPPQHVDFELGEVIDDVVSLVAPMCRHRKVDLRWNQASDRVATSLELHADKEQIRQALLNLVLNAIEAAGGGGWVRVEASAVSINSVCVAVSDSGAGPPPHVVERLFQPFVTGKPEGVGLGLAMAQQVAQCHGGMIKYSRDAVTRFEMLLPCRSENASKGGMAQDDVIHLANAQATQPVRADA